jgi:hypothetical protein
VTTNNTEVNAVDAPLDFTVKEPFDRQRLLEEALEVVKYTHVHMGPSGRPEAAAGSIERAVAQLEKLDSEQASFSPRLDVLPITEATFATREMPPSDELRAAMESNWFYRIHIPVTLFPRSGWAFTRLECAVEFCPGEVSPQKRPLIHELFPDDVWTDVLSIQEDLRVGLDENLEFRAQVEPLKGRWAMLSGDAQARLALHAGGTAKLVAGPFSYHIRRAKIRARGRRNVESFWRLDGNTHVDEEDVVLGVVLMVPKGRRDPVWATGQLRAYHDFQVWSADIFKDWTRHFGDGLRAFFGAGTVLGAQMKWEDITGSALAEVPQ